MKINFRSDEAGHAKFLQEALSSFNEVDQEFQVFAMGGHILKVERSFKLFSPFLSDIIDSLPLTNNVPNIILPDCSAASLIHLVDILTKGYTKACKDVQAVIDVGKVLGIDVKNMGIDEQNVRSEVTADVDIDLEDGEIEDSEEDYSPMTKKQENISVGTGIKLAPFSKAFMSVPNVLNNNSSSFKCPECSRTFAKKCGLTTHMNTTTKHGKNNVNQIGSIPALKLLAKALRSMPPSKSKKAHPIKKVSKCLPSSSIPSPVATTNTTVLARQDFNIVSCAQMTSQRQMSFPAGMAVNAKGDLLVVDSGKRRVQVFDKERKFKFLFKLGEYKGAVTQDKLAVFPRSGHIVVLELTPKCQVKVFSETGNFLLAFGKEDLKNPRAMTVDNRERVLVVEGRPPSVLIFSKFGSLLRTFPCPGLSGPSSVSVSSQEEIFISDYQLHCVMVYDYSGVVMRRLGGFDVCGRPFGVCLSSSGQVIVADKQEPVMKFTMFSQNGKFLASMRSDLTQENCTEVALASDGCLVVSSKDNHLYFFNYSNCIS